METDNLSIYDLIFSVLDHIATDSYRARQLLRLTCRRYFAALAACHDDKKSPLFPCSLPSARSKSIDSMLIMLNFSHVYHIFVEGRYLRLISQQTRGSSCIIININNQLVCHLRRSTDHPATSVKCISTSLVIRGQGYKMISHGRADARALIHDHIPELYSEMIFCVKIERFAGIIQDE